MSERDWRAELIAAANRDMQKRRELAASRRLFSGYHPEMEAIHVENARVLGEALDAIGWPGRAKVEDDGAAAAFMILQHAISVPDLQRRGLELILESIPDGQANLLDAAYLTDRIAMYEGRPQTFGTQFDWDANGQLSPAPIRDEASVDERRAEIGLPPMADTIAEMRANVAAEGERAPPDHAERRAQFEQWARRVGWRA
jgi:hypothetical protein